MMFRANLVNGHFGPGAVFEVRLFEEHEIPGTSWPFRRQADTGTLFP